MIRDKLKGMTKSKGAETKSIIKKAYNTGFDNLESS